MILRFFMTAFSVLSVCFLSIANNPNDTLPSINPNYKGYRLAITDIVANQQNEEINFNFTLINTGRKEIQWNGNGNDEEVVFNFDYHHSARSLKKYENAFIKALSGAYVDLKPDQILYNKKLTLQLKVDHQTAEVSEIQEGDLSITSALAKGGTISKQEEQLCSDLIIESISVVKKSNNSVTLKYKIKNQGKTAANISGASKKPEDNLAMTFHMSSSEKLTRGAIPLGGAYVKEGRQIPDGKLYPGKSVTDEIKLDIRSMTKFTPIIIIELDPYLSVDECNETNNQNHVKIKQ